MFQLDAARFFHITQEVCTVGALLRVYIGEVGILAYTPLSSVRMHWWELTGKLEKSIRSG